MKTSLHRLLFRLVWLVIITTVLIPSDLLGADDAPTRDPTTLLEQMQNRKHPKEIEEAIREILDENVQVDTDIYLARLTSILAGVPKVALSPRNSNNVCALSGGLLLYYGWEAGGQFTRRPLGNLGAPCFGRSGLNRERNRPHFIGSAVGLSRVTSKWISRIFG